MNHGLAAQLLVQLRLHLVDDLVKLEDIPVPRHLAVERNHNPPGAIVVHHQIVNPYDLLVGHGDIADLPDQLRIRGLPQKRTQGIPRRAVAGIEDEQGHQRAAPAVHIYPRRAHDHHGQKYHRGRHRVAQAVRRRGAHGR